MKVRKYVYINTNSKTVAFVCQAANRTEADARFEKYVGQRPFTEYTALRLEVHSPRRRKR